MAIAITLIIKILLYSQIFNHYNYMELDRVPGQPTLSVVDDFIESATTIIIVWTDAIGSVVDSYEVMWQRAPSVCPDADEDSITIIYDSSTSHNTLTITGRQEDSSYSITVTATNSAGSAVSNTDTAVTGEAGYYLPLSTVFQKLR